MGYRKDYASGAYRQRRLSEFHRRVDRSGGANFCWPWRGTTNNNGYGLYSLNDRLQSPHRLAWIFAFGPIPPGLFVLHRCDVKLCCNPAHLFLGTQKDNMDDMKLKGRKAEGDRHPMAKITAQEARLIRTLVSSGKSRREVADQYGLDPLHIGMIVRRQIWKDA